MVSGHKKYAPKYAAWRPDDLDAVIFSVVWKWLFNTSNSPYANPQRKKRIVTITTPPQRSLLAKQ